MITIFPIKRTYLIPLSLIMVLLSSMFGVLVRADGLATTPDDIGPGETWIIDWFDVDGPGVGTDPSASIQANTGLPELVGFGGSSLQMATGPGTGGASCARLGGKAFFGTQSLDGVRLGDLTRLSFSFLIESNSGDGGANKLGPYVNIFVDNNNDGEWNGAVDSILIYEPLYSPAAPTSPTSHTDSADFTQNVWYTVDGIGGAGLGEWHYAAQPPTGGADVGLFTPGFNGAQDLTWAQIMANSGTADLKIVNPPASGCGVHGPEGTASGLVIAVGQKDGGAWRNFVGRIDNVTLNGTTYDLSLEGPPPPPSNGNTNPPPAAPPEEQTGPTFTFIGSEIGAETGGAIETSGNADTIATALVVNGEGNLAAVGDPNLISQGVVQAVDVFAFLPGGVLATVFDPPLTVCLQGAGTVYFRPAADQTGTFSPAPAFSAGGALCVTLSQPGMLVLVGTPSSIPAASAPASSGQSTPLTDCVVTTEFTLRLRGDSSTSSPVLDRLPVGTSVDASEMVDGWYRVVFGDQQGWVSAAFVSTSGNC